MLVKYGEFEPPFSHPHKKIHCLRIHSPPFFNHHQPKWQNFGTKNQKKEKEKKRKGY
jgi:hypothetical protein